MTFQPPPPGDQPPAPPPPPPGQWGPPPGGPARPGGSFDPKTVDPLDWAIVAAGVLAFIFSLFSYYSYSVKGCPSNFDCSGTVSAWHGFFGWFATLLALIGSALVAMELFAPQVKFPVPSRVIALGLYALALLCTIIAIFVIPGDTGPFGGGIEKGHGFAFWVFLIIILAGTVLNLMRAQQTGTALPGPLANIPNIGAKGPQGGIHGGGPRPGPGPGQTPPPPPPPSYGPPQ